MYEELRASVRTGLLELLAVARLQPKDIFVVGCSTSEVIGHKIGSDSNVEVGKVLFDEIHSILKERDIFLAAQCCEHLNRTIIIEKEACERYRLSRVNAVPQPKAGGSFATAAYGGFAEPVAVEEIEAKAGMDIGDTLIGMHIAKVCVPVRLQTKKVGSANLVCARSRIKFVGGERAHYDDNLK